MNLYHYSNNHASNLRDGANTKIATFANKYGIDVPVDKNPRDGARVYLFDYKYCRTLATTSFGNSLDFSKNSLAPSSRPSFSNSF